MATPPQAGFYSTPAFELFKRGLVTQSIQKFRGMNSYTSIAALGPEWAQDTRNVIVSSSGGLSKLRLPNPISKAITGITTGPASFWDFQLNSGSRQVLGIFGNSVYYFTNNLQTVTLIENAPNNAGQWSFVTANNILFGTNGQRMQKWDGLGGWYQWGINPPIIPPSPAGNNSVAGTIGPQNVDIAVTADVCTVTLLTGDSLPNVGDTIQILNDSGGSPINGFYNVASVSTSGRTYTFNVTTGNFTNRSAQQILNREILELAVSSLVRLNGVVTATVGDASRVFVGTSLYVSGAGDATFDNTGNNGQSPFIVTAVTATTITWTQGGANSTTNSGVLHYALVSNIGRAWGYAYGRSETGHVSNISPVNFSVSASPNQFGEQYVITCPEPPDVQVDQIYWFRNLDGGGDYYLRSIVTLNRSDPTTLQLVDSAPDPPNSAALNVTLRGPLINNPPLQGLYVAAAQNRIVVFNLVGAPQDLIYSGFDQIYLGQPLESFPVNNRFHLAIGADAIAGGGILHAGIVAFSQTGRMFMVRGQLEDITLAVPVNFSEFLEELPWNLGCFSHWTVQTTPYGMVWLAADKTLQLFDGWNEPVDMSAGVYPLLRQITPGSESKCVGAYLNWLERDWYVLLAPVNGSLVPNRLFFFAFNKQPIVSASGTYTPVESVEMFVSDVPEKLTSPALWVGVIATQQLQRELCIAAGGLIQQIYSSSDTQNGLNVNPQIIPPTSGNLNAFWRSGYAGEENPYRSKAWRWARLNTDVPPEQWKLTYRLVDYKQRTYLQPEIIGPRMFKVGNAKLQIGRRAQRCSVEVDFPQQDVSANVVELQIASIPTSDR